MSRYFALSTTMARFPGKWNLDLSQHTSNGTPRVGPHDWRFPSLSHIPMFAPLDPAVGQSWVYLFWYRQVIQLLYEITQSFFNYNLTLSPMLSCVHMQFLNLAS